MANTFTPFGLHIDDQTGSSLVLKWDVHNSAQYRIGTYYKVYVSDTETGPPEEPKIANTTSISLPFRRDYFWVAVSSVVNGEESPLSPYFKINLKIGATDSTSYITIAVDQDGNPVKLRVNAAGALVVSDSDDATTDDFASESTLLEVKAIVDATRIGVANLHTLVNAFKIEAHSDTSSILSAISTSKIDIVNAINSLKPDLLSIKTSIDITAGEIASLRAENSSNFSSTLSELIALRNEVSAIRQTIDEGAPVLLRAESTLSNVGTAGTTVALPWNIKSIIKQVTVIHESGSATDFTVMIFNRNYSAAERDVVIRETLSNSYSQNRLDFIHSVPYINMQGNDELIVKIVPNQGTSNIFYVVINGEKAR